ncbi:hypothetical protein MKW94_030468 [Papaver nudicaule]|uniref:Uncharacterized protein n=1 Tax=Papaver nudicaule TaxID=74823 RepID=A0AA41RZU5_PAPNU|nr:hypothetical protein [Papaver nudicaule]
MYSNIEQKVSTTLLPITTKFAQLHRWEILVIYPFIDLVHIQHSFYLCNILDELTTNFLSSNLQITTYQGNKDVNIWSPYIDGNTIPIAPFLVLRWKVGTWISGHSHINVKCPAALPFGTNFNGIHSLFKIDEKYEHFLYRFD